MQAGADRADADDAVRRWVRSSVDGTGPSAGGAVPLQGQKRVIAFLRLRLDCTRGRLPLGDQHDGDADACVGHHTLAGIAPSSTSRRRVIIELRKRSRIAEDLGADCNRLTSRVREQFWRYLPHGSARRLP